MEPKTLFDKIWDRHIVAKVKDGPDMLYIDRHFIHEVTSPQAFAGLERRNLPVHRPSQTIATADHNVPTKDQHLPIGNELSRLQVEKLSWNCEKFGVDLYGLGHPYQGIVHVIGPELGITQPGMTIVCGDSHTSTHGAFGAWAFGIGTTEVGHVFATQSLLQRQPKTFEVRIDGALARGVTAKDLILAVISEIGVDGGLGYVIEYTGSCIASLSMDERMTICNMSIEAGARAGLMAPDETTFSYLEGREFSPKGKAWDEAVADWRTLPSDPGARYDKTVAIDASRVEPMVTYGTNPGMSIAIEGSIPDDAEDQRLSKTF